MCFKKTTWFIAWALCVFVRIAVSQSTQSFDGLLRHLAAEEPSKRSAIVDSFMTAQLPKGFPITTDTIAYFVYRGKVDSSVAVTGDYTQWSPIGDPMINVSATDLYYVAKKFEPDARLDYKFIKDGDWILDPLNPHIVTGGFGQNSELGMPSYHQSATIRYNPAIPHGTVSSFTFTSSHTGDSRKVMVYLPPGYASSSVRYPSLYVHDGPEYLSLSSMANVIDNLIDAKQIQPIIGIFIPSSNDRAEEYRLGKITQFATMMVKELVPAIDSMLPY